MPSGFSRVATALLAFELAAPHWGPRPGGSQVQVQVQVPRNTQHWYRLVLGWAVLCCAVLCSPVLTRGGAEGLVSYYHCCGVAGPGSVISSQCGPCHTYSRWLRLGLLLRPALACLACAAHY
jgi:hypothetical protein